MYIMFNFEIVASKEKFLKSVDVKSNDENMMKVNDEIPSPRGGLNEGMCFFPRKKQLGCLIKRASFLRRSEKQVLLKRIKAAINRCSLKQMF